MTLRRFVSRTSCDSVRFSSRNALMRFAARSASVERSPYLSRCVPTVSRDGSRALTRSYWSITISDRLPAPPPLCQSRSVKL